jgi:hypothetical protein
MALAKHHEEIEERWIANKSDRYEAILSDLFGRLPPMVLRAGEVYLVRGGRRMEDVEVCEIGEALDLAVESKSGAAPVEIELLDDSGSRLLNQRADGHISVPFKQAGSLRIQASSGGYLKLYTIHAVEPFRVEELPDFANLIHSLSDNPPEWTEATFGEFRTRLEQILAKKGVPRIFADGVIEYHLALFHEDRRLPSFRERFESAYGNLRWFIPYSDVARLICAYYLYCANEFEAAAELCKGRRGRLRQAVRFFLDGNGTKPASTESSSTKSGPALLVALPDLMLFQAIEALEDGKAKNAAELVAVARRHTRADFDRERVARAAYIEAHVKRAAGDEKVARSLFESLLDCPWQPIAASAAKHLDSENG